MLFHLLRTDVRRLRLAIAGWILLMASIATVCGFQPFYSTSLRFAYTGWLAYTLLFWAMQLFTVMLVPLVLQADPAVGTEAFWMTRPIRPALLASSKLLLVLILVVLVPTASMMALMIAYHVPAGEVMRAGLEMAILQTLWVAVLTVAAVLTGNIARFAVLCGAGLVLVAVTLGIVGAVTAARVATQALEGKLEFVLVGSAQDFRTGISVDHTAELVAVLVAIATAVALVLIQYRTRLRRRSVLVGIVGLMLAWLAGASWQRTLLQPPPTPPAWATSQALQLTVDRSSIRTDPRNPGTPRDRQTWVSTWLQARLTEIPPGWFATATLIDASLELDAARLESARRGYPASISSDGSDEQPPVVVQRRLLDVTRLLPPMPPHRESLLAFALSDAEVARYAPAVGHYRGRFRIGLTRAEVVATLPLQTGATAQNGAYRLVIDGLSTRQWGSGAVSGRESDATSLFDGRPPSHTSYLLRNRRTREATGGNASPDLTADYVLASFSRPDLLPPRLALTIHDVASSGFRARGISIMFPWILELLREDPAAADAWLADAELVLMRTTDDGWVERTLDIPAFPLVPAAVPNADGAANPFGSKR
jgi:hypothetical protein